MPRKLGSDASQRYRYKVSFFGNQIYAVLGYSEKRRFVYVRDEGSAGDQDLSVAITWMGMAYCIDACSFYQSEFEY